MLQCSVEGADSLPGIFLPTSAASMPSPAAPFVYVVFALCVMQQTALPAAHRPPHATQPKPPFFVVFFFFLSPISSRGSAVPFILYSACIIPSFFFFRAKEQLKGKNR